MNAVNVHECYLNVTSALSYLSVHLTVPGSLCLVIAGLWYTET